MTGITARPDKTFALVVGIEKYDVGPSWSLNGPASDACRFTDWLVKRGVPTEHILLFLSPLEENQALMGRKDPVPQPARQALLNQAITETLRARQGDLLFVFWGGHGIMNEEMSRRLFYADAIADNKRNLDLNSLLTALRSDHFSGLPRQVCFVDACANSLEDQRWKANLPADVIPHGQPRQHHEQFVFLATRRGEVARNLSAERTGLFSRELLEELGSTPTDLWPPDMANVVACVQERMEAIVGAGGQRQTPVFLWARDWKGNEGSLGMAGATRADLPPERKQKLGTPGKRAIARQLAACPHLLSEGGRVEVLGMLPFWIRTAVPHSASALAHVYNMVDTSLHYSGGLKELVAAVDFFDGGKEAMEEVKTLLRQLVPELSLEDLS